MTILFFGDVVGRLGREAVKAVLPELKKEYTPDLVIANLENLAHGKGVTKDTLQEMWDCGIGVGTSGNHIFSRPDHQELFDANPTLIRPVNYPPGTPGRGFAVVEVNSHEIAVINLMGRVFMRENLDDPFRALDETLEIVTSNHKRVKTIIIDWHAEATSEKQALGWFADGRVTAVIGTHTHVPTSDARILPQGTAYISDAGLVGARDSMLGVEIDGPLTSMRTQLPQKYVYPETGIAQVNSVYLDIDEETGRARSITRIDMEAEITA